MYLFLLNLIDFHTEYKEILTAYINISTKHGARVAPTSKNTRMQYLMLPCKPYAIIIT